MSILIPVNIILVPHLGNTSECLSAILEEKEVKIFTNKLKISDHWESSRLSLNLGVCPVKPTALLSLYTVKNNHLLLLHVKGLTRATVSYSR